MIYRVACEKKMIVPQTISPIMMPRQRLIFSGKTHHWHDIVLGVFNPRIMTAMMRDVLAEDNHGTSFDEMHNQFNYRQEFSFTDIEAEIAPADRLLLQQLGFTIPA